MSEESRHRQSPPRGRRARALVLLQALLCLTSVADWPRDALPDTTAAAFGYLDRGTPRAVPAPRHEAAAALARALAQTAAHCPRGRIATRPPLARLSANAPNAFFRTGCPPRSGHWPLPLSLLFDLPIDLNQLDASDFEALDGVGPVLARRIVDRRAELNGFRRTEDLLSVRGIGPRTYRHLVAQLDPPPVSSAAQTRSNAPFSEGKHAGTPP